jgi:hypothetical protein
LWKATLAAQTSAPGSKLASPASNASIAVRAALGAGSTTSRTYIWSAAVAHNLVLFARLKLA